MRGPNTTRLVRQGSLTTSWWRFSTYCPVGNGAAVPGSVTPGESLLLVLIVAPGSNPDSTGISVSARLDAIGGLMHNKYAIIDDTSLITGSYNWSANAEERNFENAIFLGASPVL